MNVRRIGRRLIRWWTLLRLAGLALLALAFLIGALGYLNELGWLYLAETPRRIIAEFYANVSVELASIAITILVVDALYQRRETEREKKRLILQMGSPDNAFALEAVRALRMHGWLCDGSLRRTDLRKANLQEASLWGANLQEAGLGGANLQEAGLGGANLQGTYLWDANLQGANLLGADLQRADMREANLQGAYLWGANLQGAILWGANLREATLEGASLQRADLSGANLQRANLWDADLQEADLSDASLQGAFLLDADLQEADLREAKYNMATRWSEGFTPPPEAVKVDTERE
ncbi:MAG: pentapeptide repeat-containing protein [Anaerolineales bacterium]|nr:pentapeptide repeat-containing protein [Anaerolineales bacterium]